MCVAIGLQLLTRCDCARRACIVAVLQPPLVFALDSPYWDSRVVNLDTMCCISILLHLVASLFYNNSLMVEQNLDGAASLDSILVAANIACFVVMIGLFAVNLLENKFNSSAVGVISGRMARTVVSLQLELQRHCDGFMRALQPGEAAQGGQPGRLTPSNTRVGTRVSDSARGIGLISEVRSGKLIVRYTDEQTHCYDAEAARKTLSVLPADSGSDTRGCAPIDLSTFKDAIQDVVQSSLSGNTRFSSAAIEAVFYTLLLIDLDATVVERESLSLRLFGQISSSMPLSMRIVSDLASLRSWLCFAVRAGSSSALRWWRSRTVVYRLRFCVSLSVVAVAGSRIRWT
jgi:hypothetical protein